MEEINFKIDSSWTEVYGILDVSLIGYPKHKRYMTLEAIVNNAPQISGSNTNADINIVRKASYQNRDSYFLIITGTLRDRTLEETLTETKEFLIGISNNLWIDEVLISVTDWRKKKVLKDSLYLRENYQLRKKEREK